VCRLDKKVVPSLRQRRVGEKLSAPFGVIRATRRGKRKKRGLLEREDRSHRQRNSKSIKEGGKSGGKLPKYAREGSDALGKLLEEFGLGEPRGAMWLGEP